MLMCQTSFIIIIIIILFFFFFFCIMHELNRQEKQEGERGKTTYKTDTKRVFDFTEIKLNHSDTGKRLTQRTQNQFAALN